MRRAYMPKKPFMAVVGAWLLASSDGYSGGVEAFSGTRGKQFFSGGQRRRQSCERKRETL